MRTWLIRSGAIGMALLWAVGWGADAGGFIEAFVDPHGEIEDVWPMVLGLLGSIAGVAFWTLGAISGPATWLLFRYAAGDGNRLASRQTP